MKNKEKLAKIALAAMVLAATTPITTEATNEIKGTFLAAGCAASSHGCAAAASTTTEAKRTTTTTNDTDGYNTDKYSTKTGYDHTKTTSTPATTHSTTYQYETSPSTTGSKYDSNGNMNGTTTTTHTTTDQNLSYMDPQTAQMNYGAQQASYETYRYQNAGRPYQNTYYADPNVRPVSGNPYYRNDYRSATYEAPTYQYGGRPASNAAYNQYSRPVENTTYNQYSRPVDNTGYSQTYHNETVKYQAYPDSNVGSNQGRANLTESQLKESVTPQTWETYQKLSAHAKSTALNLASQNPDKNQAVLDAARVDANQNRPTTR
ncbi:MAG: hypothetical protein Q8K60_09610 [Parachlamydiaceae bacterium]|nr:hypothetical protein [Parachlamydiaceae bacterium]